MTERVYLVRHAKAGHRDPFTDDDSPRPLTGSGWTQARLLAGVLAPLVGGGVLLSSRYTRCRQTLEPLAEVLSGAHGRTVGVLDDERLVEGRDPIPAIELLLGLPDGSVASSHGDVIPDVIAALDRRGCRIVGVPHFEKASTWILERDDPSGFTRAWSWPPPT